MAGPDILAMKKAFSRGFDETISFVHNISDLTDLKDSFSKVKQAKLYTDVTKKWNLCLWDWEILCNL